MKWWPPLLCVAACNGPQKATVADAPVPSAAPAATAARSTTGTPTARAAPPAASAAPTAALIDALVRRLLRYESARVGWWTRVYPASKQP